VFELTPLLLLGIPIAISDIKNHRIPNRQLMALWVVEEIFQRDRGWHALFSTNITALLIFITCLILYLATGSAIGMGDIKLFAVLVLPLGNLSRSITALTCATIVALIYAVVARKRVIPFGPALLIGTISVILLG